MICNRCNLDKPEIEFRKYKPRSRLTIKKLCKKCEVLYHNKHNQLNERKYYYNGKEKLSDRYIKSLLEIFNYPIPNDLIELKRQLLILKRTMYEHIQRSNPNGNRYQPEAIGRKYRHQGC